MHSTRINNAQRAVINAKMISIRIPRLSVFGRTVALIGGEIIFNCVMWIVAGIVFRNPASRDVLSLCLLAWTLGLRHGTFVSSSLPIRPKRASLGRSATYYQPLAMDPALDADHISAIDNATRGLMALGQMPVTCGLWFSLGHSTIVIIVNVAIAISTKVYDKISQIGSAGNIIGPAVSSSFLFLIGAVNSVILWRIIRQRKEDQRRQRAGLELTPSRDVNRHTPSIVLRLLGPVTRFVNRPWKVGFLFGLGFDTASSIALLAVTAIAKKNSQGETAISQADIVVLPLLFTAGMTVVDSIDSVIMLYSYSGFSQRGWSLVEKKGGPLEIQEEAGDIAGGDSADLRETDPGSPSSKCLELPRPEVETTMLPQEVRERLESKQHTMSSLSIILTLLSIIVAFSISLITIMGLLSQYCGSCARAAQNDPGLSGRWWRFWGTVNDNYGYVGAGIVGVFLFIVSGFYLARHLQRKWRQRRAKDAPNNTQHEIPPSARNEVV
ncbi:hypothetical protein DL93DRAFT_110327 [Clavulina sp. PMI_390]|nr:hypothetical protein DL93DRAFT_110327 [Clavulina sp. PMI_390]